MGEREVLHLHDRERRGVGAGAHGLVLGEPAGTLDRLSRGRFWKIWSTYSVFSPLRLGAASSLPVPSRRRTLSRLDWAAAWSGLMCRACR